MEANELFDAIARAYDRYVLFRLALSPADQKIVSSIEGHWPNIASLNSEYLPSAQISSSSSS